MDNLLLNTTNLDVKYIIEENNYYFNFPTKEEVDIFNEFIFNMDIKGGSGGMKYVKKHYPYINNNYGIILTYTNMIDLIKKLMIKNMVTIEIIHNKFIEGDLIICSSINNEYVKIFNILLKQIGISTNIEPIQTLMRNTIKKYYINFNLEEIRKLYNITKLDKLKQLLTIPVMTSSTSASSSHIPVMTSSTSASSSHIPVMTSSTSSSHIPVSTSEIHTISIQDMIIMNQI